MQGNNCAVPCGGADELRKDRRYAHSASAEIYHRAYEKIVLAPRPSQLDESQVSVRESLPGESHTPKLDLRSFFSVTIRVHRRFIKVAFNPKRCVSSDPGLDKISTKTSCTTLCTLHWHQGVM